MLYTERLGTTRCRSSLFGGLLVAVITTFAFSFVAPMAFAQQKPATQQKPAAKKQTATGKDAGKKKPSNAWVKLCEEAKFRKDPKAEVETKKICLTHHERLDGNTGLVLVSAAIRKVAGQKKERFMVMVPLGMAIPPGIQVKIDKEKPIELKYTICHAAGCTAEVEATKDLVAKMKKGKNMAVFSINMVGKPVVFPVPLAGFDKALDGAPVDSKKYQNARRQLMAMIRKRQIELAKKAAEEAKKKKAEKGTPAKKEQKK